MACVGYIRPYLTSFPMLIEMQSRVVAKVFAGKVRLPAERATEALRDRRKQHVEFPCNHARLPFLVDPYDYMNALAKLIDAVVPRARLLVTDPSLAYCLCFDSWNHFAYRLNDTDVSKRRLARDMILRYHNHPTSEKIRFAGLRILAITILLIVVMVAVVVMVFRRVTKMSPKREQFLSDIKAQI